MEVTAKESKRIKERERERQGQQAAGEYDGSSTQGNGGFGNQQGKRRQGLRISTLSASTYFSMIINHSFISKILVILFGGFHVSPSPPTAASAPHTPAPTKLQAYFVGFTCRAIRCG